MRVNQKKHFFLGAVSVGVLATALVPAVASAAGGVDHSEHSAHDMSGSGYHDHSGQGPSAPLGIMGDHIHAAGEWMFSYRKMTMTMEGNRDGETRLSPQEVTAPLDATGAGFKVAPTDMVMDMHMLGAMYAFTDTFTLMAMVPYVEKEMNHRRRDGLTFVTEADGIGDVKLSGLFNVFKKGSVNLNLGLGLSFPTGSIEEVGLTPVAPTEVRLPYPMQLGSGTYDILPSVTYSGYFGKVSWGSQLNAVIRTSDNDEGYTLGDEYQLSTWAARRVNKKLSLSMSLAYKDWGNIDGADVLLQPLLIPTADTQLRGGSRTDLGLGLNFTCPDGMLKGHKFAVEYKTPLQQRLDGPQLETDRSFSVGWKLIL